MPSTRAGRPREIGVDVEEARTGDVAFDVQPQASLGLPELPAAVDELVAQAYQLPPVDTGSSTEAGWIT